MSIAVELPDEATLVQYASAALKEASERSWNALTHNAISSSITKQLKTNPNMFCYYGKPSDKDDCDGRAGSEWGRMFDFCALFYREPAGRRFLMQAAIVGETERNSADEKTDEDFEKLLIADSIVCFFVCRAKSREEAVRKLDTYQSVIKDRETYARLRGTRLPRFLLACYIKPQIRTERPPAPEFRTI